MLRVTDGLLYSSFMCSACLTMVVGELEFRIRQLAITEISVLIKSDVFGDFSDDEFFLSFQEYQFEIVLGCWEYWNTLKRGFNHLRAQRGKNSLLNFYY